MLGHVIPGGRKGGGNCTDLVGYLCIRSRLSTSFFLRGRSTIYVSIDKTSNQDISKRACFFHSSASFLPPPPTYTIFHSFASTLGQTRFVQPSFRFIIIFITHNLPYLSSSSPERIKCLPPSKSSAPRPSGSPIGFASETTGGGDTTAVPYDH